MIRSSHRRCSVRKGVLRNYQNSQENTCAKDFFIIKLQARVSLSRSSTSELFLRKGVLKICSKFTREHPCRSTISINLLFNFIEIALWHGCSPVDFLYIFRTLFPRNTSGGLYLDFDWTFLLHKIWMLKLGKKLQIANIDKACERYR